MDAHREVTPPARCAHETMAAMPADAHALPWPPCANVVADGIDVSRDFMPWHTWILQPGPEPLFHEHITMANAACFDFHAHVPGAGLRDIALNQFPVSIGFAHLRCLHCGTHHDSYSLRMSHRHCGRGY